MWNQVKPSETRWNQVKPHETRRDQVNPSSTMWNNAKPRETTWNRVRPSVTMRSQVKPSKTMWNHVRTSETDRDPVKSSERGETSWVRSTEPPPPPHNFLSSFGWPYRHAMAYAMGPMAHVWGIFENRYFLWLQVQVHRDQLPPGGQTPEQMESLWVEVVVLFKHR